MQSDSFQSGPPGGGDQEDESPTIRVRPSAQGPTPTPPQQPPTENAAPYGQPPGGFPQQPPQPGFGAPPQFPPQAQFPPQQPAAPQFPPPGSAPTQFQPPQGPGMPSQPGFGPPTQQSFPQSQPGFGTPTQQSFGTAPQGFPPPQQFSGPPPGFSGPPQPGYGAPPGYPQQPGFPPPGGAYMSPPRKGRGGLIAIIAIVVVIVIVAGTVAAFAFIGKKPSSTANNTPSASTPTTAPSPTSSVPAGFTQFKNDLYSMSYPSDWEAKAGDSNDGSESFTSATGQLFQILIQQHADESQIPAFLATICAVFGDPIGSPTVATIGGTAWQQETCGTNGEPVGTVEATVHNGLLFSIDYASLAGTFANDKTQFFAPMEQSFAFVG